MESRSYNFSTARKRSTQMESKVIYFPREEESAPRSRILQQECPDLYSDFKNCIAQFKEEAKCRNQKDSLSECGKEGFRKANTDHNYVF